MFNFLNEKFQKVSVLKKQIFVTLILALICLGIRLSLDIIVSGLSFMGILDDLFASFIAFTVLYAATAATAATAPTARPIKNLVEFFINTYPTFR